MAQRSMFFNDTETEPKVYFAEDEARYNYLMMAGDGIAKQGDYEPYEISPKQNMVVTIGSGAAFIKGYLHEVYDTPEELELDTADPTYDRIDRIVLRFINTTTQREIILAVLKGTPSASPTPPTITRTEDVYEMSLAQITVEAGKSFIESYQIKDEKNDPLVCGYSPLHNILRGIKVTESGIFSVINSPQLTINSSSWSAAVEAHVKIPLQNIENINNVKWDNDTKEIIIEETGIYLASLYYSSPTNFVQPGDIFQIICYINGVDSGLLARNVSTGPDDRIFLVTFSRKFNAGEKVSLYMKVTANRSTYNFNDAILNWAKIQ